MKKSNLILGIILTLVSALAYAILTAIIKSTGDSLELPVVIFIQLLTCFILCLPILISRGPKNIRPLIQTNVWHLHIFRTIFSLGISYFLFYSVKYIPLVNGILLANTAPLIVPFLSYFFLSQKINSKLWIPLLTGFIGVIFVLRPTPNFFHPAALLAFGAGICMASSMLIMKTVSKTDKSTTGIFYYFLFGTIISGLVSIPFWHVMTSQTLLIILSTGLLFFIVQMTLTYAIKYTEPQIVSSLYYSNIIFAALISVLYWHNPIRWFVIVGIILALVGGVLTIRAQAKSKVLCCPVE